MYHYILCKSLLKHFFSHIYRSYTHVQYYHFFCYHVVRNSQTLHLSYHNYITPKTSDFTQYSINRTYTVFHVQHMLYKNWVLCLIYCFIIIRSFICNMKRPSVKQSVKQQVSSNCQIYPGKTDD